MLKENPPTLSAHSGRYAFKSVSSHYGGRGEEGGESNLSSIFHVWGRGGKLNLSSIDHVWGVGEGGGGNHDGVICGSKEGGGVG